MRLHDAQSLSSPQLLQYEWNSSVGHSAGRLKVDNVAVFIQSRGFCLLLELDLSSEVSGWCVHRPLWSSVAQTSVYRGQIYLAPLAPVGKERPRRQELQQEVRKLQTEDFFGGIRSSCGGRCGGWGWRSCWQGCSSSVILVRFYIRHIYQNPFWFLINFSSSSLPHNSGLSIGKPARTNIAPFQKVFDPLLRF